jgi:hypothetical protein
LPKRSSLKARDSKAIKIKTNKIHARKKTLDHSRRNSSKRVSRITEVNPEKIASSDQINSKTDLPNKKDLLSMRDQNGKKDHKNRTQISYSAL